MSAGKRPRQPRLAPKLPITYEEAENEEEGGDCPKRVRETTAPPPPQHLNTFLDITHTSLADPNRALLRRVFRRGGQI